MKTILVTGANGFIGSHTIDCLQRQPEIRLIAACRDKSRLPAGFAGEVREGDLRDRAYLDALLDGVDVLVHAAAWSSLWGHQEQSHELFYRPTIDLIERFSASRASRWVNISTTSAAAPEHAEDALATGIPRPFWPHLCNVIRIENTLRAQASPAKTVVNLRLGLFVGQHYGLGLLPILLPRLKTRLVPWVAGGQTHLPLADGRDFAQGVGLAALKEGLQGFQAFNLVGKEIPSVRQVILFLHEEYGYPRPWFGVSFPLAYRVAWLMERLDPLLPWEPLIVRSIVHLLEETGATNERAEAVLGYRPQYDWRDAIRLQIAEMSYRQHRPMKLVKENG
jgi:nucleoside-diphosphate-sugar epimerase